MSYSRGVTLVETLVALLVLMTVLSVSMTVFMLSHRQATMTRMRSGAVIVTESFFEEVADHEYGSPPYPWWPQGNESVDVVFDSTVDGRVQDMSYRLWVSYENGSFVGRSTEKEDVVTLTVDWGNRDSPPLVLSQRVWKPF
jgi:pilin/secretion family protein with methylation motif